MRMTVLISIMALLAGMNGVPLHAEEPDHGVSALAPKSLEEYRSWTSADKERIYEALVTTALGIAVAIGSALLFRRTILAGPPSPFVMELPPYRLPTPRGVLLEVWRRGKGYLQKAGVVILGVCLVIWALSYFPRGGDLSTSYLGRAGRLLEPAMRPLGLDWRATVALASGFLAKESVVGTLGVLYGVGEQEEALRNLVRSHYGPAAAMSMMIFVLLYVPCVASMAVMGREIGWRWALFSVGYTTAVAYLMALLAHWASLGSLLAVC